MKTPYILCRYQKTVEEIAEYKARFPKEAKKGVLLRNNQIVADGGDLDQEFWFLNQRIKGQSHIIVVRSDKEELVNDPDIKEILKGYIELSEENSEGGKASGSIHGRKNKRK